MAEGQGSTMLASLQAEIRQVQVMLKRLLAIPWKERGAMFQAGLLDAISETTERMVNLLLAQSMLRPGVMAEFQRQAEEVIDEIVAGWDGAGKQDETDYDC